MRHRPENHDLELALRRSLHERSGHAPAAGPLAERILATVERPVVAFAPPRRHRAWRTWGLPLLAAGAAAAVVGAVAVVQNQQPQAGVPPIASPTSSLPSARSSAPAPSASPAPTSTPPASTGPDRTVAASGSLQNLRLLDVTFDAADDGWALASSACLTGRDRCTALLRTTDGTAWTSVASTPFNVPGVHGCAGPCVQHLRFANSQVGYAYGPAALFITLDGARTWQRQSGGAEALETLDNNVIRVVSSGPGCPGPCDVHVQVAAIGSSTWTTAKLAVGATVVGLAFSRGGSAAYLLAERNPVGGANDATSTLYASTDDGATWHAEGEPCPQVGGKEVDSHDVAAASGTRLTVLCTVRGPGQRAFVAISTDGGRTAADARGAIPVAPAHLAGDPRTVLAAGGNNGLAVSRDGGATWTTIPNVTGSITFIGFESATIGRAIADDGQSLWTTRDGGLSWQRVTFR